MKALLLTGRPGVGKTTLIRRVADTLKGERLAGFYTEELRSGGERTGFRIVTFEGSSRVMASSSHYLSPAAASHRPGSSGDDGGSPHAGAFD
jgi:nucleoside-triphosphatase THEP1